MRFAASAPLCAPVEGSILSALKLIETTPQLCDFCDQRRDSVGALVPKDRSGACKSIFRVIGIFAPELGVVGNVFSLC